MVLPNDSDSNFELITSLKCDGDIPLAHYRSKRTGISVVVAQTEGPIVNGFMCIATEAHDDDGLPHTLEHLVFLGSENYPYKGVLDLLANRSLASGSNAWTQTDHTCYTMTTAGSEGFLNLLPIYLDHVLYPILSDSGFITEVHHINGKGEDAGVVYCEMQATENTGESRSHVASLRSIYPGHCGYKSVTGGIMQNLRESTTNEKIKAYHKQCYRPDNLCIIVTGQVNAQDIFKSIQCVENKIISKGKLSEFVRPWESPVPPFEQSVDQLIEYPCDDEKHGMVDITWRGPEATKFDEYTAITILLDYLTDTSTAPLQQEFVEIEDPFCSDVEYSSLENSVSAFSLEFENVPVEKLPLIKDTLIQILSNIANGVEKLDMERMETMIKRRKLHILKQMENDSDEAISGNLIGNFLYGRNEQHLKQRTNQIPIVEQLLFEKSQYWLDLLKRYFVSKPMVSIAAKPSAKLSEKMAAEEKLRLSDQRKQLGKEGLKQKGVQLESAIEQNEIEPPQSMLTCIKIPSVSSIKFHPISRCASYVAEGKCDWQSLVERFPCRFQLDDVHSMFVTLNVFLNVTGLPEELRLYLPLWTQLITESPILRKGALIPFEQVVNELNSDTITINSGIGIGGGHFSCGAQPQLASLQLSVEKEKYRKGVTWLRELLFDVQFQVDRVSVVTTKLLYSLAAWKREGFNIASVILKDLVFDKRSSHWVANNLRQEKFLTQLKQKLKDEPARVVKDLETLRSHLTQSANITIHMTADVDSLVKVNPNEDLATPWKEEFIKENCKARTNPPSLIQSHQLLLVQSAGTGIIAGVGAVESAYMKQWVHIDVGHDHPDLPALLVLNQYLVQLEGPMWKEIRGRGLAYHYDVKHDPKEHSLYLVLYKCTHLVNAYKEAMKIVENHVNGTEDIFEETLLESSRSSLIFELIEKEKSVADVSYQSQLAYFGEYDMENRRRLLASVATVTIQDMERVGPLYLSHLFDNSKTNCAVVCHPSKVEAVVADFKEISKNLTVVSSLEESQFAQY